MLTLPTSNRLKLQPPRVKKQFQFSNDTWLSIWTVNGLRSKWIETADFICKHDITVLTETMLNSTVTSASLQQEGYVSNRMNRESDGWRCRFIHQSLSQTKNNLGAAEQINVPRYHCWHHWTYRLTAKDCASRRISPTKLPKEWFAVFNDLIHAHTAYAIAIAVLCSHSTAIASITTNGKTWTYLKRCKVYVWLLFNIIMSSLALTESTFRICLQRPLAEITLWYHFHANGKTWIHQKRCKIAVWVLTNTNIKSW